MVRPFDCARRALEWALVLSSFFNKTTTAGVPASNSKRGSTSVGSKRTIYAGKSDPGRLRGRRFGEAGAANRQRCCGRRLSALEGRSVTTRSHAETTSVSMQPGARTFVSPSAVRRQATIFN
jgi:hypothetical protein